MPSRCLLRTWSLLVLSCLIFMGLPLGFGGESRKVRSLSAFENALRDPFDRAWFEQWLQTLPFDGHYFVVEGDLLLTREEAMVYIAAKAGSEQRADVSPELLVNRYDGADDFYRDPASRSLTYRIDRRSFPSQAMSLSSEIQIAMQRATGDWQRACPACRISFTELADKDATTPNFVVRFHDVGGAYIAAAFFPHQAAERRVISIDPSFFKTSFDRVGVLRHELGHVLGYRHEHTRGVAGCYYEDGEWRPLTPYDPRSVMHYLCGGGGSFELELTQLDRDGHRKLYTLSGQDTPLSPNTTAFQQKDSADAIRQIYRKAFAAPFDGDAFWAYLKSLPRQEDYYVVEGDIRMTEQEIRTYLVSRSAAPSPTQTTAELLVNLNNGRPDYYAERAARRLTYSVDRNSFPDEKKHAEVAKNFRAAARAWEKSCRECGISFVPLQGGNEKPNFVVRYVDVNGAFIAAAFFPHQDQSRRYLDVDESYFRTSFDRIGVLRHEIGHILGYRHEHIRDIPGCAREGTAWVQLTRYDPKSVMHYFCGGAGSRKLELTNDDRGGHRKLYMARSVAYVTVPLLFHQGDVISNLLQVLTTLDNQKALKFDVESLKIPEAKELVFEETTTRVRLDSLLANRLLNEFNPKLLAIGTEQEIRLPDVLIRPTDNVIRLDKTEADYDEKLTALRKRSAAQITFESESKEGIHNVHLRMYEVQLFLPEQDFQRVAAYLREIPSTKALVSLPGYSASRSFSAFQDPPSSPAAITRVKLDEFWEQCTKAEKPKDDPKALPQIPLNLQGDVLSALGVPLDAATRARLATCQNDSIRACPNLVLIDEVALHPDIKPAILDGGKHDTNKELVVGSKQIVEIISSDRLPAQAEHGTHLAGLIAAQDNGFGIVGVHPGAHVFVRDWNPDRIYTDMQDFEERLEGPEIYVFTSHWEVKPANGVPSPGARAILGMDHLGPLWIVAAGQKNQGAGDRIDSNYPMGPMNLGDRDHVIVVTGVLDNGTIALEANHGSQVSVAAPYGPLPSTISLGRYVRASGTSQSAALVGGLASAMMSLHPVIYHRPRKLKHRIMVTATPSLPASDLGKVASGVINADLALRDPREDLRKPPKDGYRTFHPSHWCTSTLDLTDSQTGADLPSIPTKSIRRLYRRPDGWIVYTINPTTKFERIGPGKFKNEEMNLLVADKEVLPPSKIDDIILGMNTQLVTEKEGCQ